MDESDVAFITHDHHRRRLWSVLADLDQDDAVLGIVLAGSLARGDALPGADVDLYLLVREGTPRSFTAHVRDGILVEQTRADLPTTQLRLLQRPMSLSTYLDGRILHDPAGLLPQVVAQARVQFAGYRWPPDEQRAIVGWLCSARSKLTAAQAAGDDLKAAYVTATTAWKILEGLWAVNDTPMPPSGAVWAHLADLADNPAPLRWWVQQRFTGTTSERSEAAVTVINHIVTGLEAG